MSTNREGRWPFLRPSAREQEASTKQLTSLGVWTRLPGHCGPLSLALACVLTWGRVSISKLLTVILFIICIFISQLWPATTSHCHFRFWSFWTLLLPLKKWMFFKDVKGVWLWRGAYSRRTYAGPSGPGLSSQLPLSSRPSRYHHSAEVPFFGRNQNLPWDFCWLPGGYMALEQQSLEFPCAILVFCLWEGPEQS